MWWRSALRGSAGQRLENARNFLVVPCRVGMRPWSWGCHHWPSPRRPALCAKSRPQCPSKALQCSCLCALFSGLCSSECRLRCSVPAQGQALQRQGLARHTCTLCGYQHSGAASSDYKPPGGESVQGFCSGTSYLTSSAQCSQRLKEPLHSILAIREVAALVASSLIITNGTCPW